MADSVVIIDSSDDESSDPPSKKAKYENDWKDSPELLIIDVKSLANVDITATQNTSDVIEIDSDENASEKENSPKKTTEESKQLDSDNVNEIKHRLEIRTLSGELTLIPVQMRRDSEISNPVQFKINDKSFDDDVMVVDNDNDEIQSDKFSSSKSEISSTKSVFPLNRGKISSNNTVISLNKSEILPVKNVTPKKMDTSTKSVLPSNRSKNSFHMIPTKKNDILTKSVSNKCEIFPIENVISSKKLETSSSNKSVISENKSEILSVNNAPSNKIEILSTKIINSPNKSEISSIKNTISSKKIEMPSTKSAISLNKTEISRSDILPKKNEISISKSGILSSKSVISPKKCETISTNEISSKKIDIIPNKTQISLPNEITLKKSEISTNKSVISPTKRINSPKKSENLSTNEISSKKIDILPKKTQISSTNDISSKSEVSSAKSDISSIKNEISLNKDKTLVESPKNFENHNAQQNNQKLVDNDKGKIDSNTNNVGEKITESLKDREKVLNINKISDDEDVMLIENDEIPNNLENKSPNFKQETQKTSLNKEEITDQETPSILLENFIKICTSSQITTKYKDLILSKTDSLLTKFSEADSSYIDSKNFKNLINVSIDKIKKKPENVIVHFKMVYDELKVAKRREINLTVNQERHLSKLSKTMKLLDKKIRRLEQAEVDFDDDNDSTYIQLERYKQRFVQVHEKYCKILKQDKYAARITHRKLDFSASKYVEINRAIDRLYARGSKFPLFEEVDSTIRNTVKNSKLNLSEAEIIIEVKKMHKEMGTLIQRRRKCELDEVISVFLGQEEDPAVNDQNLKEQLDKQLKEANKRMDEVFETYTKKQLEGENPPISPDSDDSNLQSDYDDDDDDDNGNNKNETDH